MTSTCIVECQQEKRREFITALSFVFFSYLHCISTIKTKMNIFFEKNLQSLMETMEQQRHSLSSVPMLSRLDHLDFVVKFSFPSTMIKCVFSVILILAVFFILINVDK